MNRFLEVTLTVTVLYISPPRECAPLLPVAISVPLSGLSVVSERYTFSETSVASSVLTFNFPEEALSQVLTFVDLLF